MSAGVEWKAKSLQLLKNNAPFDEHHQAWAAAFADDAVKPMWFPPEKSESNIADFIASRSDIADYAAMYQWSIKQREQFWQATVDRLGLAFETPPDTIVDLADGVESPKWLPGARFNIVDSCFQGEPNAAAIVANQPDGTLKTITVAELREQTLQIAGALHARGFKAGDAIAIVMPMTPESIAIYLGIIAAGCVAVSIADSFAAAEIQTRLEIANAKGIFCVGSFARAGRTIDLFSRVVDADAPPAIVLGDASLREDDVEFSEFLSSGEAIEEPVGSDAGTHVNILFSSGTTGEPKAIPWTQSVPIKCAADGMWHHDIRSGDVVVWPTNIGWMMGPWLIFASLINRAAIGLYHDAPTGSGFGQFVQDAKVTMLGVVPTIVRAWRASGCMEDFDWSTIRCFSSTGEASNPDDMFYLSWLAEYRPVIEYCGGTEIGGGYACSTVVQPNAAGCFSTAALGSEFVVLDENGDETDEGELFIVPPSMGLSTELLNRDHHETYYAGVPSDSSGRVLRRHGDYFERLPGGYYRAGGRSDDTMNLGGIKVSSAEIERILNLTEGVRETAAVAVPTPGGGPSQLIVFVVAEPDCHRETIKATMSSALKTGLNPLFRIADVRLIESLPRTASNKVMRRKLRSQVNEAS
ncbi:MAG: AMP-binding protein [Planctomycetaceae bacterium]